MKTVFRIGMEVYDQVNNPYKKGKVLDIKEDEFCHKIHSYDILLKFNLKEKTTLVIMI